MSQHRDFEFFDTLFLRAPLYSLETYELSNLPKLILRQEFRNALWLASPDFYRALEKKDFEWSALDQKEKRSLRKYYNRMAFRPTPFGAFSSFSLVKWNDSGTIRLRAEKALLHLLPSREWEAEREKQGLQSAESYLLRTNPTLFRLGPYFRFICSTAAVQGKLEFHVNEIKAEKLTAHLIALCEIKPLQREALCELISNLSGCPVEDAASFLDFLVHEQVLLTEYAGSLLLKRETTGENIRLETDVFPTSDAKGQFVTLLLTPDLDLPGLAANGKRDALMQGLNTGKPVFYAGLEREVEAGGLNPVLQIKLLAAVNALKRLVIPYPTPALKDFTAAFKLKFEGQRVPLLQALDPDKGISYGQLHRRAKPQGLLDGLAFSRGTETGRQLDWTPVHRLLLRIWLRNTHRFFDEPVMITENDIAELEEPGRDYALPPSLAIMFIKNGEKLILDNTGGASSISLIGRFSAFSPDVETLCREIAREEAAINPEVVFAEIHQLSDTHVDNINRRKPIYDHLLTINTYPPETGQRQIPLRDLLVSVQGNELWLESVALGKRIVPRLPTAYNFHHNDLAIFQFLCDLQFQGLQANFTFDPEKLFPGLDFYPRFEFGDTLISLARWKIKSAEIDRLIKSPFSLGGLHQFRLDRSIPALITMGLGDRQLTFNLVNDEEALFFLDCLRDHQAVTLREFIPSDRSVTTGGKSLTGQFIALLKNPQSSYTGFSNKADPPPYRLRRDFPPGSEWLYVKIYCTPESADMLLLKAIGPLLKKQNGLITRWFFIRYQDPEPHIRLRINCQPGDAGELLTALQKKLAQRQFAHLVREIKTDTYSREIERYSEPLMEATEAFFCFGSKWVLERFKPLLEPGAGADELLPFVLVYQLAFVFFADRMALPAFFKWRADGFLLEFGGEKELKVSMDRKYREISKDLKVRLNPVAGLDHWLQKESFSKDWRTLLEGMAGHSSAWPGKRREILLADLIHMQVNRIYPAHQRQHEALIYYCLYKHSFSLAAAGQ